MLYDGWPLAREPISPAALHLLAVLESLPGPGGEIEAVLALPESEVPDELAGWLSSSSISPLHLDPGAGRLRWEQWSLPQAARRMRADLIHLAGESGPLLASCPVVYSPCEAQKPNPYPFPLREGEKSTGAPSGPTRGSAPTDGLKGRVRSALAAGSKARGQTLLWPEDLPSPEAPNIWPVPPVVTKLFAPGPEPEQLPSTQGYILCHALPETGPEELETLAAAWSWAGQAIGVDAPLYILGLTQKQQSWLRDVLAEVGLMDTVQYVSAETPQEAAKLYRQARALLHVGPFSPWGDPLSHAMASGLPVAAVETTWSSARVGPAGYLVPAGDSRGLGAALVTLAVEDSVAEALSAAARQRLDTWESSHFPEALVEVYQGILGR